MRPCPKSPEEEVEEKTLQSGSASAVMIKGNLDFMWPREQFGFQPQQREEYIRFVCMHARGPKRQMKEKELHHGHPPRLVFSHSASPSSILASVHALLKKEPQPDHVPWWALSLFPSLSFSSGRTSLCLSLVGVLTLWQMKRGC